MRNKSVNTILSDDIMDNKLHGCSQHKSSPKHFWMRLIKLVSSVMRDASYFKFQREYIALDYGIFLGNLILI